MAMLTVGFGVALIALTGVLYAMSSADAKIITAFIPSFAGIILVICGGIAHIKPNLRMHLMHVAVLVGLLGLLAAGGRFLMVLFKGGPFGLAFAGTGIMSFICLAYVGLCVKSFIDARKNREAQGEAATEG